MKTNTFSIVVGTQACNANCPYCVAKMTRAAACETALFSERRFNIACRVVDQARDGLITVALTGQGEPLLWPKQITRYLDCLNFRFPLVGLWTNGILIEKNLRNLGHWENTGLTHVCISITHHDPYRSSKLMGIKEPYRFWDAVEHLKRIGLAVRLNCTMLKSGIHQPEDVEILIDQCRVRGVDQLTFREVEMPSDPKDLVIADWVRKEKPIGAAEKLNHYLDSKGATKLLEYPHGGIVYDVRGQNVCVSNCLTVDTDPNDTRQIIFFPDGRIAYDWRYRGARIL